jgi:hypothetical protein
MTAQWSNVGQQTVLPGHSTNSVKVCPLKVQVPLGWSDPPLQPTASKHAAQARAIFICPRCVAAARLASAPLSAVHPSSLSGRRGRCCQLGAVGPASRPPGLVPAGGRRLPGKKTEQEESPWTSLRRRRQFPHRQFNGGHQCRCDQRTLDGDDDRAPKHHWHSLRRDECDRPDV